MEQVRAGVVAHRVSSPLGVDDGRDRLTDPQPPVERPAMNDQPAERLLGVLDGKEGRSAAVGAARLQSRFWSKIASPGGKNSPP